MRHFTAVPEAVQWLRAHRVSALHCDSRRVCTGDAFIAWPGLATDGRAHVPAAFAAGAQACLVEADGLARSPLGDAAQAEGASWPADALAAFSGLKAATGELAARFYGHPSAELYVLAITGTNGKTSTAWWLAQALAALGRRCGLMGTLGVGEVGPRQAPLAQLQATGLTTPDPVAVQAALRRWVDEGFSACAVEASSIGLEEGRLSGTQVAVAVFTNFTQDHLDYHGSMEAYWAAKRALFQWSGLRAAVINVDDVRGHELARALRDRTALDLWTVSLNPASGSTAPARLHALACTPTAQGMRLVVAEGADDLSLNLNVVGRYNAANLLGVLASLRALGVPLQAAGQALGGLLPVPGRMQVVSVHGASEPAHASASAEVVPVKQAIPLVLVDYAHTPDALAQALSALRPVALARGGQLHCVVGCGGDRDAGKRPLMAAQAEALADQVCLTSDNPRSEDPQAILNQMVAGLKRPDQALVLPDRAAAIARAVAQAQVADVVLIAGKGHETTQEVAGVKHPFSDVEHAMAALQRRQFLSKEVA
jgi:UDP-N-acetylmuramoyl-L-alanyl-D-glutamate--2,6-diaminopimelate ligase